MGVRLVHVCMCVCVFESVHGYIQEVHSAAEFSVGGQKGEPFYQFILCGLGHKKHCALWLWKRLSLIFGKPIKVCRSFHIGGGIENKCCVLHLLYFELANYGVVKKIIYKYIRLWIHLPSSFFAFPFLIFPPRLSSLFLCFFSFYSSLLVF